MRAIIMAGGKGERLKPYTRIIPKPLMPIGDVSILEIVITRLKNAGIDNITIAVGYLGNIIQAYLGDGDKFGVSIDYVYEQKPLSTIGPLNLVSNLKETFLVINGDILSDINIQEMLKFHYQKKSNATIATYKRKVKIDFGVIEYNDFNRIIDFIEKPEYNYKVSMGIYIFEPSILKYIPKNTHYGLDSLIKDMIENKDEVYSYDFDGYWLDIGRPDDYEIAIEEFSKNKNKFL